ncbi:uncharacterized protein LOC123428303 [Hordeum vulgare subsp. vulgare]|uniref:Predicted protein n=1 Tax=Hordeum vulgare subsp. vulgare TaxID=112509 RepID=F2D016_HORVV|nr:uncharacterized protein LOC123428303 [Hordeum vulgare subsp. vulgare]BAJ88437.1 predicted protein [Hordeum vulgare subsp. vulgare]
MTLLPSVARGHRAVKLQPYLHKLIDALFPDWVSLTTNLETYKINELIRLVLMPWWYVCIMRSLSTQGLHKDPKRSKATIKLCINRTCRGSLQVAGHIQVALNVHESNMLPA